MLDFWKFCFCYLNQCLIEPRDVRFLLELNLQNPSSSSEINVIRLKFTFYFPRNQQSELQNRSIRQKNFITRSSNLPSMKNLISKQFPLKILTKNSWKTWTLLNNTRLELQIVDYSEQLVISPVIAFCIGIVENPRGMKLSLSSLSSPISIPISASLLVFFFSIPIKSGSSSSPTKKGNKKQAKKKKQKQKKTKKQRGAGHS